MKYIIKNALIVLIISIISIVFMSGSVNAAEPQIQIIGDSIVKSGYQTMKVKIEHDEEIGVIECNIQGNDNVESIEVDASYNGWTINYNNATGKIIAYNAVGTKSGEIIQFKYKVKNVDKSAKITLSNIELTTISYNTLQITGNVEKNIIVESSTPTQTEDENTTDENNTINEVNQINENNTESTPSNKSTDDSINNSTNNNSNKNNNENITKKIDTQDTTTSKSILPKTGINSTLIVVLCIVMISGIFSYIRYSIYRKDIK